MEEDDEIVEAGVGVVVVVEGWVEGEECEPHVMDSIPARPGRSPNEDRKILVGVLHGKGCTMF